MKRIYIAAKPEKKFITSYIQFKNESKNLDVKWVIPSDIHLTIIPPWNVKSVTSIIENLKNLHSKKLSLDFFTIEISDSINKVIWVKAKTSKEILNIRNILYETLKKQMPKKTFLPHITIAKVPKKSILNHTDSRIIKNISWRIEFNSISLIESKLYNSIGNYDDIFRKILD